MTNLRLSAYTQLPNHQQLSEGVHVIGGYVIGVNNYSGLFAIAKSQPTIYNSAAGKTIEIFLDDMEASYSLDEKAVFDNLAESISTHPGDILMAQKRYINVNGIDYLRTTLSRFPDEITMALRQINTRVGRNKTMNEIVIVLTRVDQQVIT